MLLFAKAVKKNVMTTLVVWYRGKLNKSLEATNKEVRKSTSKTERAYS